MQTLNGVVSTMQSTYTRWKRGHAHTAEEGSGQGDEADPDRPELSSSEDDDEDVISEAAPEEQPSGARPRLSELGGNAEVFGSIDNAHHVSNASGALAVAMTLSNCRLREMLQCLCAASTSLS
jgi:hypothetical protein